MTEKELKAFSHRNRSRAWKEFYPEGKGQRAKPGYVLHHKDPTWKYNDPIRYAEWRIEDLEMLTYKEHSEVHNNSLRASQLFTRLWNDSEYRDRVIASMKMVQNKPDIIAKHSDVQKKRYLRGELDYLSDMMIAQWADPIKREQRIESLRKTTGTLEFKDKVAKRMMGNTITKGTSWWTDGEHNKMCLECPRRRMAFRKNLEEKIDVPPSKTCSQV